MSIHYFAETALTDRSRQLIHFDIDSIRQVVSASQAPAPETWLVDPRGYEQNGRPLRDSDTSRVLAYSPQAHTIYATDGCNSCSHRLPGRLEEMTDIELIEIADSTGLQPDLVQRLADLVRGVNDIA